MRPPLVSGFVKKQDVSRLRQQSERSNTRDRSLLKIINFGLILAHEEMALSTNALMVLALVAATPGIGVSQIAQTLHLSPGGVSKLLDQLSTGRMVRGERQPGLDLIQRE